MRDLLTAKGFDKDPNLLANSYYHANKALSGAKDVIPLPADDAPVEQWRKFNAARGVPENADGYDAFKFKDGVQADEKYVKWARGFFHELGVPKGKAQAAIEKWQDFVISRTTEMADDGRQANAKAIGDLEVKHGKEKWNSMIAAGQVAFKSLGVPPETIAKIEALSGAAPILELFAALGAKLPAESAVIGNGGTGIPTDPTQMTSQQLDEHKRTLEADKDFMEAYNKGDHPKHKEAVERMLHINTQIVARRRPR